MVKTNKMPFPLQLRGWHFQLQNGFVAHMPNAPTKHDSVETIKGAYAKRHLHDSIVAI